MATQNSGINLFDQDPQDSGKKDGKRTAFALGALAALGVAGALGVGFVLGGGAGNGNDGGVKGDTSEPTRVVRISPTAAHPQAGGQTQPQAPSGNTQPGDTGSGGEPPAPTNTPEPPAPTDTPVPPTETPTDTPTATPPATSTPSGDPCPWCPDLDLIDPGIIIDLFPPQFDYANSMNCPAGTLVGASVNEDAEMWVTYTVLGLFDAESEHVFDVNVAIFNIGGGPFFFPAGSIVVHARDAMGNESSQATDWMPCL